MTEATAADPGLDLQKLAHSFCPIIVTAPTARNGITLIQRLLNSTRQAMIFGENSQFTQTIPWLAVSAYVNHHQNHDLLEQSRQTFIHETTEYWSSNLWPDSGQYMMLGFEMFYKAARLYRQSAQHFGFHTWGLKNPMTDANMVHYLGQLMRPARFVMVYRNPIDVVASAKARQFITSEQDVANYAAQWQQHLEAVRDHPPNHLLMVQHERLTSDPESVLAELEQFTGLSGIDRSVLGRRINTFTWSDTGGHSSDGYIPPQAVTDAERELIYHHAGRAMQWAGYEPAS